MIRSRKKIYELVEVDTFNGERTVVGIGKGDRALEKMVKYAKDTYLQLDSHPDISKYAKISSVYDNTINEHDYIYDNNPLYIFHTRSRDGGFHGAGYEPYAIIIQGIPDKYRNLKGRVKKF